MVVFLFTYEIVDESRDDEYFEKYKFEFEKIFADGDFKEKLKSLKYEIIPNFIKHCFQKIDWGKYSYVGFSCTFQQIVPSIALAKLIKAQHPHIKIVFGGSAVENPMGTALRNTHPFIDKVISGEGEIQIVDYIKNSSTIKLPPPQNKSGNIDLENLPTPDYESFYNLAEKMQYTASEFASDLAIPVEFSRGCWWGAKKHCTFCGLNGNTMAFRSKSSKRALQEIDTLSKKYNRYIFQVVDNIMDFRYFKDFLPVLAKRKCDYEFFFEVKSNLKPSEIRLLKESGCNHIQPGIESLSTNVLSLMQKGTTALQNISLLKWAQYYGIGVDWNLLNGFPGEQESDYKFLPELFNKLTHLRPPSGFHQIRIQTLN